LTEESVWPTDGSPWSVGVLDSLVGVTLADWLVGVALADSLVGVALADWLAGVALTVPASPAPSPTFPAARPGDSGVAVG
jgi:hypothetical protein